MSNYAILRVEKIKNLGAAVAAFNHTLRAGHVPNADPKREELNTYMGPATPQEALERMQAILPDKRRKDAVIGLEYLVTASPSALASMTEDQVYDYFNGARRWLVERHGAENVVCAAIHRDESTQHMHVYVVPMSDGHLRSKKFIGGAKTLADMQTDFALKVGVPVGLDRGAERSKAKHTRIASWYANGEHRDLKLAAAMETILDIPGAYEQFETVFARMQAENAPAPAPAQKAELEIELDSGLERG